MYNNLTLDNNGGYYHEVWLWVINHHYDFIKAWHYGYETEEENLYTTKFSSEDLNNLYIGIHRDTYQVWFSVLPVNNEKIKSWFTELELKKFNFWENPAFIVEKVK